MEHVERILAKLKDARKERGYSHENMAHELHMSQAAYSNMENNVTKLTVERLIEISIILEKPIHYFFETSPTAIGMQHFDNLYQDTKRTISKLTETYETAIQNLKEEIIFLRELVQQKG